MPRHGRVALKLFVLSAFLGNCSAEETNTSAGAVIQVKGVWRFDGHADPLLAGESIPLGAFIKADPGVPNQSILVVLANKTRLVASCTETPCRATLPIPKSNITSDPSFENILAAVKFVLFKEKRKVASVYESTSSRGGKFSRSEVIVSFEQSQSIQLPVPEGSQRLTLTSSADGHRVLMQDVIQPQPATNLQFPMQSPGLYVASFADRFRQELSNTLVVVARPEAFESINTAYEQARAASSDWNDDSAHLFIRAYLLSKASAP